MHSKRLLNSNLVAIEQFKRGLIPKTREGFYLPRRWSDRIERPEGFLRPQSSIVDLLLSARNLSIVVAERYNLAVES